MKIETRPFFSSRCAAAWVRLVGSVLLAGCQMKPTRTMEESVNVFAPNTVMVDTRSAFFYQSFHIEGSINLNTSDFLVIKNAMKKIYALDPDIDQTIERLAHRGITPQKKVILISDVQDSVENKKWHWLLKNLEVEDVTATTLDQFRAAHKNGRFGEPSREEPWKLKISEDLQKEFILKKADACFVKWSDRVCT